MLKQRFAAEQKAEDARGDALEDAMEDEDLGALPADAAEVIV